ncbi:MAG: hypothetical protein PHP57_02100 [Sideroxydans sp.]|nr:hypothetical protein [Sideroxydans sp.]
MTQNSNDRDKANERITSESVEPEMSQYDLDQEEKARTLIERGEMGFQTISGRGEYAGKYQAIHGKSEDAHEENLKRLANALRCSYSEIFLPKPLPAKKRHRTPRAKTLTYGAGGEFPGDDQTPPTHITQAQFIELYSGVCFANNAFGVALNTHVTIHWGALGIDDQIEAASVLQEQFIHHLKAWMRYKKAAHKDRFSGNSEYELCWIYSHENSPYGGFHTHLIVGIPDLFRKEFAIWTKHRFQEISKTKELHDKAIFIRTNRSTPITSQWHLFQYICKGLNPDARVQPHGHTQWLENQRSEYERRISRREPVVQKAESTYNLSPPPDELAQHIGKLHTANQDNIIAQAALYSENILDINTVALKHFIDYQYENPGYIYCKQRVNMSRNIARSARKKRGFQSLMELGKFSKYDLYTEDYYKEWLEYYTKSINNNKIRSRQTEEVNAERTAELRIL